MIVPSTRNIFLMSCVPPWRAAIASLCRVIDSFELLPHISTTANHRGISWIIVKRSSLALTRYSLQKAVIFKIEPCITNTHTPLLILHTIRNLQYHFTYIELLTAHVCTLPWIINFIDFPSFTIHILCTISSKKYKFIIHLVTI